MASRLPTRVHLRLLAVLLAALLAGSALRAADASKADAKLYDDLLRSTVWVNLVKKTEASGRVEFLSGTGSLIDDKNKLVITNYHVVRDKDEALVQFPSYEPDGVNTDRNFYTGRILKASIPGKVVARDPGHDLALIELDSLPAGVHALHLSAKGVKPGEQVHFLGNPGDSDKMWVFHAAAVQQVELEHIHSKTTDGFENNVDARVIMTDTPSRPGESGGPLINEKGELAGVTHGHRIEKLGPKEIDMGVFIDLSEVKALLQSKTLLAKTSTSASAGTEKDKPKPPADKPAAEVKEQPKQANKPADDPEELEATAARRLKLARSLARDGLVDKARERYEEIVKQFPKTKAAAEARDLLDKLDH
jgi:S1-C subfamily serine protease